KACSSDFDRGARKSPWPPQPGWSHGRRGGTLAGSNDDSMAIRRIAAVCGGRRGKTSGAAQACISCILRQSRLDRTTTDAEPRGGSRERSIMSAAMSVAHQIREKLIAALNPMQLQVIDESHRHTGHAGARPGGETHFRIEVVAAAFR